MDTSRFMNAVLADEGMYCIFGICSDENKLIQKFYPTLDIAKKAAYQFDHNGYDTYFALATFTDGNNRTVENINQLKALFLDLDCGEEKATKNKGYVNQTTAIKALQEFCNEFHLPKPTIVNSGRGVHVYWPLTEVANYATWLPVAERLKQTCIKHGLLIDSAVTADGARILRVPKTHNYKDSPPREVSVLGSEEPRAVDLDEFADLLPENLKPVLAPTSSLAGSRALMDKLAGNTKGSFKKILEKTMRGTGCSQIKIIATDQGSIDEPLWRAGLSIAKFCEDSEKAAYVISHNHPDYDEDETYNKLDLIKGPYLCATFNEYNPDVCTECPHWGKFKSPIVLGKVVIESTEEDKLVPIEPDLIELAEEISGKELIIPDYPNPYFRPLGGGIYVRYTADDGENADKMIYANDFYVVGRLFDPAEGECAVLRHHLPNDPMREFNLPLHVMTSTEEFRKAISREGIMVDQGVLKELMNYTRGWINELQQKSSAANAKRQYGWHNEYKSFVVGDKEITADKVLVNHPCSPTLRSINSFKPKGTLEGWKKMISFFDREGMEPHQLIVCANFGSVLMEFLPDISAAVLHAHHKDSGHGKTTAMLAGSTAWGCPKDLVVKARDTKNTQMNRAELYKNLPLNIDEVTNIVPEQLSEFAYEITSADGRQRNRLESGGNRERIRGEPWSLLCISTGNTSMLERISIYKEMPKAEAQRVLEMVVKRYEGFVDTKETTSFNIAMNENYGHAGPIFMDFVIGNLERVKKLMFALKEDIDKSFGLTEVNRFWSGQLTCELSALFICKKLGLLTYDFDKLKSYCKRLVQSNQLNYSNSAKTVSDLLVEFMNEYYINIMHIHSGGDLFDNNNLARFTPTAVPRGQLAARYETDTHVLAIVPKVLKKWCVKNQINYGSMVADLQNHFNAVNKPVRLYSGTDLKLPAARAIVLNFNYDNGKTED